MQLVQPSIAYKASFIEAAQEFEIEKDNVIDQNTITIEELEENFNIFVEKQISQSEGRNLPDGYVPMTTYWLVEGGVYIGKVNIRHYLNDHLLKIGGHIGYSIRPSKRGRGYGNHILALALHEAKRLGIDRALLTCDATNIASRKIIERNGGVIENVVSNPVTSISKLRFWIDIA